MNVRAVHTSTIARAIASLLPVLTHDAAASATRSSSATLFGGARGAGILFFTTGATATATALAFVTHPSALGFGTTSNRRPPSPTPPSRASRPRVRFARPSSSDASDARFFPRTTALGDSAKSENDVDASARAPARSASPPRLRVLASASVERTFGCSPAARGLAPPRARDAPRRRRAARARAQKIPASDARARAPVVVAHDAPSSGVARARRRRGRRT